MTFVGHCDSRPSTAIIARPAQSAKPSVWPRGRRTKSTINSTLKKIDVRYGFRRDRTAPGCPPFRLPPPCTVKGGEGSMKITKLETFVVPPRWLFLKIETDAGIVGWGEPVVEGRAHTVQTAVEELSDYLIGKDPLLIEDHWQVMYRAGFYRGGPIGMSAIAGVDQALWDIKGKHHGVPVHALLGGQVRD